MKEIPEPRETNDKNNQGEVYFNLVNCMSIDCIMLKQTYNLEMTKFKFIMSPYTVTSFLVSLKDN